MAPDLIARLRKYSARHAGPDGEVLLGEAADALETLMMMNRAQEKVIEAAENYVKWRDECEEYRSGRAQTPPIVKLFRLKDAQAELGTALINFRAAFPGEVV